MLGFFCGVMLYRGWGGTILLEPPQAVAPLCWTQI